MGQIAAIRGEHADIAPDGVFDKAAGTGLDKAAQIAAHNMAEAEGTGANEGEAVPAETGEIPKESGDSSQVGDTVKMGDTGLEPVTLRV